MRVQDEVRQVAEWVVKDLGLGVYDYKNRGIQEFYRYVRPAVLKELTVFRPEQIPRLGAHVRDGRPCGLANKIAIPMGAKRTGREADLQFACAAVAGSMAEFLLWRAAKRKKRIRTRSRQRQLAA